MTIFRNIPHLSRRSTALLLMSASMAMLLVFQGLWLRKVYDEQKNWLQKEAETLFQQTIRDAQDSLINATILEPLDISGKKVDTAVILTLQNVLRLDMSREKHPHYKIPEKMLLRMDSFAGGNVKITINTDSISRGSFSENTGRAFFFTNSKDSLYTERFEKTWVCDTVPIQNMQVRFQKALVASGINLKSEVLCAPWPAEGLKQDSKSKRILTLPIPAGLPPQTFYYGAIGDYDGYLFKKILPQGLFSLILLLCTGLAFGFIYRSLRQQQRLAVLKNDFISNVAHELKTPIATVGVAIESLRNFDALREPERTAEYLDISKHELNRLSLLVDKVLKMAIFEQKEPDLNLEHFDFSQLVQEVLNSMKLQFEKCSAIVSFTAEGSQFEIEGDRIHLTNVVYNLIDNALKYSEGQPAIQITLNAEANNLEFTINDQGIGIPPEFISKVFEKFFRVPTGNRHNVKGYGLGLSYVAGVVSKHRGRIRVESTPGKGSRFVIQIPRNHGKN